MRRLRPLVAGIAVVVALALPAAASAATTNQVTPPTSAAGVFDESGAQAFTIRFVERNADRIVGANRNDIVEANATSPACLRQVSNTSVAASQLSAQRALFLCLFAADVAVDFDQYSGFGGYFDQQLGLLPVNTLPNLGVLDPSFFRRAERLFRCVGAVAIQSPTGFLSSRPRAAIAYRNCVRVPPTYDLPSYLDTPQAQPLQ